MSFMQDKFYNACKNNDIDLIEKFLNEESYDISGVYNNPFIIACSSGNLEALKYLLEKFGPMNQIEKWGNYGFRWACSSGNLNLVTYLLEKNPEINIGENWNVAFRWACDANQLEIVKWFHEQDPVKYDYIIITKTKSHIQLPNNNLHKSKDDIQK